MDYSDLLTALSANGPQVNTSPLSQPGAPSGTVDPSVVPTFTPPPNPGTAIHHGILGKIGAAISGGVNAVGNNLAPVPSGLEGLLSPSDLHHARSAGFLALGNSLLNPTLDARGFKQSTLGSIASGLQNGQQASAQSMGGALQASQYAAGLAQTQRVNAARSQVGQMLQPQPGNAMDHDAMLNRIEHGVFTLTAAGDDKGATALDGLAKGIREGKVSAQQAYQYMQNGDGIFQINKADGTVNKIATNLSEQEHERARRVALANASENTGLRTQTNFAKLADPFTKASAAFANYHAVEAQALAGNPAATKTLVTAFASAADPKVQQRLGTIQYLQNVDPSLAGRMQRFLSTSKSGTLPPDQIKAMSAVVKQIEDVSRQRYEAVRHESIRENARVEGLSAPGSVQYNDPTEDGTAEPAETPVDLSKFYKTP